MSNHVWLGTIGTRYFAIRQLGGLAVQ